MRHPNKCSPPVRIGPRPTASLWKKMDSEGFPLGVACSLVRLTGCCFRYELLAGRQRYRCGHDCIFGGNETDAEYSYICLKEPGLRPPVTHQHTSYPPRPVYRPKCLLSAKSGQPADGESRSFGSTGKHIKGARQIGGSGPTCAYHSSTFLCRLVPQLLVNCLSYHTGGPIPPQGSTAALTLSAKPD